MQVLQSRQTRDEPSVEAASPVSGLAALSLERLEEEIGELAAHIHAATCRWLLLVAEFDRREGWKEWGCKSCADWLSLRCGLAPGPGREHVRVARRLEQLPELCAAFGRGELSFSKVRAITRVADFADESELLELARHATAAQLERLVRAYRGVVSTQIEHANRAHEERFLSWSWDDDGSVVFRGRLPAEDGALLIRALEAARDQLHVPAETSTGESDEPVRATNADALALMADTLLASGAAQRPGGERYQVVVHVDAAELDGGGHAGDGSAGHDDARRDHAGHGNAGDDHAGHGNAGDEPAGRCELDHGPPIPAETARRLACDSSVLAMGMRDGRPLTVGRKTRSIPPALRRALRTRDGGCCFPGCTARRFVDAHHIHHWAHGGETKLSNLLLLCRHHHRLVHEGGFQVHCPQGSGGPTFSRPDGRVIAASPRGSRGDCEQLRGVALGSASAAGASNGAGGGIGSAGSIGPETCWALSRGERLNYGAGVERLLASAGLLDPPDPLSANVSAETPQVPRGTPPPAGEQSRR